MLRQKLNRICRRCSRFLHPISAQKLSATLNQLIPKPVNVLFIHSSLSSCGRFLAGPSGVIDALSSRTKTLGFPTHSYSYPEPGQQAPLFDWKATPSRNGILTESFRQRPGVVRSIHSTHSLAFHGPQSTALCNSHYRCETPCGSRTPYERMVLNAASVLLIGVTFHAYTLFHTAEDSAGSDFAYESATVDHLRVVDEHGNIQTCTSKRQSRVPRRFSQVGEHLVRLGLVRKVPLGRNYLYFVPNCEDVHHYLVEKLRVTPDYLYLSCTKSLA